jgi:hypothetical protein
MPLAATAWLTGSTLVPGLLNGFDSCYLASIGSGMCDRSRPCIDGRVRLQFGSTQLLDIDLARKAVSVAFKPIFELFSV